MTIFDLLFIAVFFAAVGMLVLAGVATLRSRRAVAIATIRRLGIFVAVYLGIVILVSLASPRRVLNVGDEQCWDDWCLTVTDVRRTPHESANKFLVTIRMSSRARRAAQRGRGTQVYLMDGQAGDMIQSPIQTPYLSTPCSSRRNP
jgi:hypothetical protein